MDSLHISKRFCKPLFLAVATVILTVCGSAFVRGQQIQWESNVDVASKKALETQRLVWLHFEADWCVPCQRLETFVFSSTGVIRAIDQNVVAVKIDVDQAEQLVKKMGVQRVPHDIVMTPSGRIIMSRPSPKTTAGYRKFMSDLDRPLQQLNSGDRDAINFGIDQIQRIARGEEGKGNPAAKGFAVDAPKHEMAAQTVQGQRLARGFESAKRASEMRSQQAAELKQKAKLFIAAEERKLKEPQFAQNPFFKQERPAAGVPPKKPMMLKRDFDSATKNTKSFSPLGGQQQADAMAAQKPSVQVNQFVHQQTEVKIMKTSGVESSSREFLPPLPPDFSKKPLREISPKPVLAVAAFDSSKSPAVTNKQADPIKAASLAKTEKPVLAGGDASVKFLNVAESNGFSSAKTPATKPVANKTSVVADNEKPVDKTPVQPSQDKVAWNQFDKDNDFDFGKPNSPVSAAAPVKAKPAVKPSQKSTKPDDLAGQVAAPAKNETARSTQTRPDAGAAEQAAQNTATLKVAHSPKKEFVANDGGRIKGLDTNNDRREANKKEVVQKPQGSPQFSRALQMLASDRPEQRRHPVAGFHPVASVGAEKAVEPTAVDRSKFGLQGNCPVTLLTESRWVEGQADIGCMHRNRVYLFASKRHRDVFQKDPDAFSPILAGFDPVTYEHSKKLVDGQEQHGVFMGKAPNLRVVLFENAENRAKFQADPGRYLNLVRRAMTDAAPKATKLR